MEDGTVYVIADPQKLTELKRLKPMEKQKSQETTIVIGGGKVFL